jgi:pimeloyl-ACP methyl ester carboxylesterase
VITRRTTAFLTGVTVVALLASGCGVASRAQDAGAAQPGGSSTKGPAGPVPTGLEKFYQQKPTWERCGSGQQCATITVPLDYSRPTGKTIELRARKVLARDRVGKIGTLFVNPGGPGASGMDFAAAAKSVFGAGLLRDFDIVGWDPRGVGQSTPVRCLDTEGMDAIMASDGSPDNAAEVTDLENLSKEFAAGCLRRSGDLLAHLSTKDAARDIDVLRGIVGDSELYYYGASYGTLLGATYAELFPKNVGRMVLDGAVDPAESGVETLMAQAKSFDVGLDAFAADCARRSCPLGSSKEQVLSAVDKVIADSDSKPLQGDGTREVTQGVLMNGLLFPLYARELWPALEKALVDAQSGDGSLFLELADQYRDRGRTGYTNNSFEALTAVSCADRVDIKSIADAEAEQPAFVAASPRFGRDILWGSIGCAYWPVKPVDKPHAIKAPGAKPIVVVGTTRDPVTPYQAAVALAGELDSGVLITRDGDGHTAYASGNKCVDNAVDTYLLKGTAPATDPKC